MTQMEPKDLTYTWSPDGSGQIIDKFYPDTGELWYVDNVRIESDGSGNHGSASFGIELSVGDDRVDLSNYAVNDLVPNTQTGNMRDDVTGRSSTGVMDAEINEYNVLNVIAIDGGQTTSATFYIHIRLRRMV